MKLHTRLIFAVLILLLALASVALVFTRNWTNLATTAVMPTAPTNAHAPVVDQSPLDTALRLASEVSTSAEQQFAQLAVHAADQEVDLAFSQALRDAAEHPAPLSPEARDLASHIQQMQAHLDDEQAAVDHLKDAYAKARGGTKDDLYAQLEFLEAQLALDQDELNDAHQDFIRAGGDEKATVQQMLDDHEQSLTHQGGGVVTISSSPAAAIETTTARNVIAQFRAWSALRAKREQLESARQNILNLAAKLANEHEAIHQEIQKSSSEISNASPSKKPETLARIRRLSEKQKSLAEFDKRIDDLHALAGAYSAWSQYLQARQRIYLRGLLVSAFWILLVAVLALVTGQVFQHFFFGLAPERRVLLTLRSVLRFAVQALGIVIILMIVFGVPTQFATALALAGAGLTVALKDFIVGFFGWFVLMGRNGIRAGDWVEINGVTGEVEEVGLLRTILLETGNWTDASHPTGRRVTFVNSFAIEGHYFNFSTSGQWMWDQLELQVPADLEPYKIADAIQKMVAAETESNARLAEAEWQRSTPTRGLRSFSAQPALSVQPSGLGVNILVRFITRANERYEVRSRIYRAMIELLHRKNVPEAVS
ncbi:MAG: mechanosensitive ion channel domain-containing protein [Candidatus Acidiferrales bacterium]